MVSVIIPVHDNPSSLADALQGLSKQTYPSRRLETIVVHNGSICDLEPVRRRHPGALWLFEEELGSYRARNRGVRSARGEVLAFTDSDCIPEPDWVEQGVRSLLSSRKAGLVAGRIRFMFERPERPGVCELYDSLCSLPQEELLASARFGATANLFTWREIMQRVGLFDGKLASGGDREWGNRVFDAGLAQVYCADAVVLHASRRTVGDLIRRSLRVTAATMVAGPDAAYTAGYFRRHLADRPKALWRTMSSAPSPIPSLTKLGVLGLYFSIKALQSLERLRIWLGGRPRRQ